VTSIVRVGTLTAPSDNAMSWAYRTGLPSTAACG